MTCPQLDYYLLSQNPRYIFPIQRKPERLKVKLAPAPLAFSQGELDHFLKGDIKCQPDFKTKGGEFEDQKIGLPGPMVMDIRPVAGMKL